jgi:hypothetical protein
LARNLLVGTNGDSTEAVFQPVMGALSQPIASGVNAGFYRQDASLALIFITDAEDQSNNNISPDLFYDFLLNLKGARDKIITYGAIVPSNVTGCARDGGETPLRIERFFQVSGGKYFGLCDVDYGVKLGKIGFDLESRVGRVLYLDRLADPSTIVVTFDVKGVKNPYRIPPDLKKGWVYDPKRNAIIFGSQVDFKGRPKGAEVEVTFTAAVPF